MPFEVETAQHANPEQITERLITRAYAMVADAERLIAEQRQKIRQLETLSFCDALTGLMNRRGFEAALSREIAAAAREPDAAGVVLMVDLDGFKAVNDTFGHAAGDAYLSAIAHFLTGNCRESDIVARLGGDEFALILPRTRASAGQKRAGTLLARLNEASMNWQGHTIPLRASFGASAYTGRSSRETVLGTADARLYAQKAVRRAQKISA